MTSITLIGDIVEANGKTIRENNMKLQHNIPIGTLVEVKYDEWMGGGCCQKVHARLWVVIHSRDCDGTPLYRLCKWSPDSIRGVLRGYGHVAPENLGDLSLSLTDKFNFQGGFGEESLTVIEITDDVLSGEDSLEWEDDE